MSGESQQLPGPVHLLLCVGGLQEPGQEHVAVQEQQDCGENESVFQFDEVLQEEQVICVGQWEHTEQHLLVR